VVKSNVVEKMPMHTCAATSAFVVVRPDIHAPASPPKLTSGDSLSPMGETPLRPSPSLTSFLTPPLERITFRSSSSSSSLRSAGLLQGDCPASPSLQRSMSKDSFGTDFGFGSTEFGSMRNSCRNQSTHLSLLIYGRFHGMIIGPVAAKRCIESFTGRVLSLPSTYLHNSDAFPARGISPWDTPLSLSKYYFEALLSLTGLSTLLCLTDIVEAYNLDDIDSHRSPSHFLNLDDMDSHRSPSHFLKSAIVPELEVDSRVLEYLANHSAEKGPESDNRGTVNNKGRVSAHSVKLVRKFEFLFRLSGTRAVILHFKSVTGAGDVVRDSKGREVLHCVEVYETGWGYYVAHSMLLQVGAVAGLLCLGAAFKSVFKK